MSEQMVLIPDKKVRVTPGQVQEFSDFLTSRNRWVKAFEIHNTLGFTERQCRALKAAARGRIISGQRGYRMTLQATLDEISRAATWLRSQAAEMMAAARDIELVRHHHPHLSHP